MLYVIISTGQKIHGTKLLQTRPGGEIGDNVQCICNCPRQNQPHCTGPQSQAECKITS